MYSKLDSIRLLAVFFVLALEATAAQGINSIHVPDGSTGPCGSGNPNGISFGGNCGAIVNIGSADVSPAFVQDNVPSNEQTYRVRSYVNLRKLQMHESDEFDIFASYDGGGESLPDVPLAPVLSLSVRQTSFGKVLVAKTRTDSGVNVNSATFPLRDGWRSIEINWARATAADANDGRFDLWIDGTLRQAIVGVDNDTIGINYSRWGAVSGLDVGTVGVFWIDDFISRRVDYIGPSLVFTDVPLSSSFLPFIQGIYAAEVMPGCAAGAFCAENPITRKEMAKFLLTAKFGASFVPPSCVTQRFSDVPCSDPYAPWINEMARLGITGGCGGTLFCPEGNITRAQMAVFLMVAIGATPAPCPPSAFADIQGSSPFCPWIKEIARRGITAGCGGGNFCPENLVLRGQMAVFLTTTFNLPTHLVGP